VCLLKISSSQELEIVAPPNDAVVTAGSTVELGCEINQQYEGPFEWLTYIGGQQGGTQLCYGPPFTPISSKYSQFGDYGLEISNVEWRDAGKYVCKFLRGNVRATAVVIVVGQWMSSFFYFCVYSSSEMSFCHFKISVIQIIFT